MRSRSPETPGRARVGGRAGPPGLCRAGRLRRPVWRCPANVPGCGSHGPGQRSQDHGREPVVRGESSHRGRSRRCGAGPASHSCRRLPGSVRQFDPRHPGTVPAASAVVGEVPGGRGLHCGASEPGTQQARLGGMFEIGQGIVDLHRGHLTGRFSGCSAGSGSSGCTIGMLLPDSQPQPAPMHSRSRAMRKKPGPCWWTSRSSSPGHRGW